METGAGLSTIVLFLLVLATRRSHPMPARVIGSASTATGTGSSTTPTRDVRDVRGRAAHLRVHTDLDLIIVDGNHAFPAPMIDWFYMTRHLRTGGVLVVDDVELWTGPVLADFLDGEAGIWEQVDRTHRFAVYRLDADSTRRVRAQLGRSAPRRATTPTCP